MNKIVLIVGTIFVTLLATGLSYAESNSGLVGIVHNHDFTVNRFKDGDVTCYVVSSMQWSNVAHTIDCVENEANK